MDHLDPASSSYALAASVIRLYARQLFTHPPGSGLAPVPDVATHRPDEVNGGISADGRTYTIRLRRGVCWDTDPVREVTAADFVRGFKRMCNPVAGSGWISYFTSTIEGMAEYSRSYKTAFDGRSPGAAELAEFQNTHEIGGVRALDDRTLVLRLLRPANDFLSVLSMRCASAAPQEYDEYVPDSPGLWEEMRSNGPYRVVRYEHGRRLRLARNPAWRRNSDPVRCAYVDAIDVRMERVNTTAVAAAIMAGEADLAWGSPVVGPCTLRADDYPGYSHNPYLVLNFMSSRLQEVRVRRAIARAIDRESKVKIFHDLGLGMHARPVRTVIPPGNLGHEDYDPFPEGPLSACAGPLTLAFRDVDMHPVIARSVAADLRRQGFDVALRPVPQADYYRLLQSPSNAREGLWDIAVVGWTPDWYGNNGRTAIQPMLQTNNRPGTSNYGCYSNRRVDDLIERALSEPDLNRARRLWHEVDELATRDVAIIPMVATVPAALRLAGARVRNTIPMADLDRWFDLSGIWLAPCSRPDT